MCTYGLFFLYYVRKGCGEYKKEMTNAQGVACCLKIIFNGSKYFYLNRTMYLKNAGRFMSIYMFALFKVNEMYLLKRFIKTNHQQQITIIKDVSFYFSLYANWLMNARLENFNSQEKKKQRKKVQKRKENWPSNTSVNLKNINAHTTINDQNLRKRTMTKDTFL